MTSLLEQLNKSPGAMVAVLLAAVLVLGALVGYLAVSHGRQSKAWSSLLTGSQGANLEDLLRRHFEDRQHLTDQLADATERINVLERKIKSAKRYAGLVRYDAFEEIGGSQSFAMAIYDEEGNGVVLTSQVGREGGRVYGKALVNGKSDRNLSVEEESAIKHATNQRAQPRISP